jgi:hypothetical protein
MRFGWFFALPLLFVALLAGSCGYAMGVSSGAVAPVAAPAVYPMWGFGGFFPFFGFIFFLVVIFAIVGAFKRHAWGSGYGPRGGYGRGYGHGPGRGYGQGPTRSAMDAQFEEWHRRMHGEPANPSSPPDPNIPDDALNRPWDPPTPPDENTKL